MGFPIKDVVLIERFPKGLFVCSSCLARRARPVRPEQQRDLANLPDTLHFAAGIAKSFSG